jgi:hypothetical protein
LFWSLDQWNISTNERTCQPHATAYHQLLQTCAVLLDHAKTPHKRVE